jgi:hypothetical protein
LIGDKLKATSFGQNGENSNFAESFSGFDVFQTESQIRFVFEEEIEFFLNKSYLPVKESEKVLFAFEGFTVRFKGDIESVTLIFNFSGGSFQCVIFSAEIAKSFHILRRRIPERQLPFQSKSSNDSGIDRIGFGFGFERFGVISNFIGQNNGNLIAMLQEEVREVFIIDTGGFHNKDQRNIVRNDEFFDPKQEEFEARRRVFKRFGLRNDSILLGIDGTKAGIEGFVRDIDTDGLF